jgi:beta-lactamase regulating signal transducer with metallopeptidase domain
MSVLIMIAVKSLLIAGLTLGLLDLMRKRSAAERSWVAHVGLLALVIIAFAPLVLPSWTVEAPAMLGRTEAPVLPQPSTVVATAAPIAKRVVANAAPAGLSINPVAAMTAVYAVPAAVLLLITFIALARLVTLQARAEVLVDSHWLSALARAQRRMGFKYGTALLTSNELASPISWGLMRPVILLNTRAVEATDKAEAIIAHELAHVARLDWAKLLLARVATALFWFNPLVWLLAREAHQLREETADDSVLAADIADTDYAQLLVGVARHESPGLLLGAHGVAPSSNSLARRVARVLDAKIMRGPAAGSFAAGVFVGALVIAAPLAALTLVPNGTLSVRKAAASAGTKSAIAPYYPEAAPADLPSIISEGVSTSVKTAVEAIHPAAKLDSDYEAVGANGASVSSANGVTVARAANGASTTIYPPDANGRRRVVMRSPSGAVMTVADAGQVPGAEVEKDKLIDKAVQLKAAGVTPDYVAEIRAAAPQMQNLTADDFVELNSAGVTADYIHDLARQVSLVSTSKA